MGKKEKGKGFLGSLLGITPRDEKDSSNPLDPKTDPDNEFDLSPCSVLDGHMVPYPASGPVITAILKTHKGVENLPYPELIKTLLAIAAKSGDPSINFDRLEQLYLDKGDLTYEVHYLRVDGEVDMTWPVIESEAAERMAAFERQRQERKERIAAIIAARNPAAPAATPAPAAPAPAPVDSEAIAGVTERAKQRMHKAATPEERQEILDLLSMAAENVNYAAEQAKNVVLKSIIRTVAKWPEEYQTDLLAELEDLMDELNAVPASAPAAPPPPPAAPVLPATPVTPAPAPPPAPTGGSTALAGVAPGLGAGTPATPATPPAT